MGFLKPKIKYFLLLISYFLLLAIPVFLFFKNFFLSSPLSFGDAPFFYPEGLKELVSEPLSWTNRGNNFGGINQYIFIWPLMFLYGILGSVLKLGNDLTVRILFYFPSIILSIIGPMLLTRYLKFSKTVSFFASLTYLFSTYYILLIDGGQVGVALAYGIFPLTLLFLKKLLDIPSFKSFWIALIFSFLLTVADPRISVICLTVSLFWISKKSFISYFLLLTSLFFLNLFWIFPLFKNGGLNSESFILNLSQTSILHSLTLFSPHWPENIFGKLSSPPFYFVIIPILIFVPLIFVRPSRIRLCLTFLFLIFAFLTKGSSAPFGQIYSWLVDLPFGFAFRDSSKFFIPTILFAGVLIGNSVDLILSRFRKFKIPLFVSCYLFFIFLIFPALFGCLNFNLSNRKVDNDFRIIYENLKKENDFSRTVWISDITANAFETFDQLAVDGRKIIKSWPFAYGNASEDPFNFINNPSFVDEFGKLGIKYLILSGNPRNLKPNHEDVKNWNEIISIVENTKGLEKQDWGTKIPIYKISDPYPRFYSVDKLIAVIGSNLDPNIYSSAPVMYFEDGKWDPKVLEGKSNDSLKIYFNEKNEIDLTMSFLQKHFLTPNQKKSDWAIYSDSDYLKYKYQLLIRRVKHGEFDYGKGISFSTKKGEILQFETKLAEKGEYLVAIRSYSLDKNGKIKVQVDGIEKEIIIGEYPYGWNVVDPIYFEKGKVKIAIENQADLSVVNTLAIIPKEEFEKAKKLTEVYIEHFGKTENLPLTKSSGKEVKVEKWGTLKFKFEPLNERYWLIFNDNYNFLWKLKRGNEYFESVPLYSMVNVFYADPKWGDLKIEFKGQDNVRWGIYYSVISFLVLSIVFLWLLPHRSETSAKIEK